MTKVQNKWTTEQRTVIHLLFTEYDILTKNEKVDIFNRVFSEYLQSQGIGKGLDFHRLDVQYRERLRVGKGHLWTKVIKEPGTQEEIGFRNEYVAMIEDAADALGISIPGAEQQDDASTQGALDVSSLSLENNPTDSSSATEADEPSDTENEDPPQDPDNTPLSPAQRRRVRFEDSAQQAAASNTTPPFTPAEKETIIANAKRTIRFRPDIEVGEDYLYMIHSSAPA